MKLSINTTPNTWYKDIIKGKLNALQEYLKVIEDSEKHIKDLQRTDIICDENDRILCEIDLDTVKRNPDWESMTASEAFLGGYSGLYTDYIPDMVRYGAIIVLYSIFEAELNNLCRYLSIYSKFLIKPEDIQSKKNGYIGKSKKYLQKVVAIGINDRDSIWAEIIRIQKIRNLVVHNNGIFRRDDPNFNQLVNYINSNTGFFETEEISFSHSQVRIKKAFLGNALDRFTKYFEIIQEGLNKKYGSKGSGQANRQE